MENLPLPVSLTFAVTCLLTGFFLYKASHYSRNTLIVLLCFLVIQSILGLIHFYEPYDIMPPRFQLLPLPPLILILILFLSPKGRAYIDSLDIKTLTILHIIRIPVELVLFWLYTYKYVPELMTFEGRNFDILSGITAPIIYYIYFVKQSISPKVLLVWNVICLILLFNIVIHAVLSTPTFLQQMAFDQPNVAIFYFPFNLLPAFVVPIVLFSHLAAIRKIMKGINM